jgi:hypothetical protein
MANTVSLAGLKGYFTASMMFCVNPKYKYILLY